MVENQFQRQTAKIVSVKELLNGDYIVQEGWKPNYIQSPTRKLVRINFMGIIIEKPNPFELIVDDGTGSVLVNDFNRLKSTQDSKIGQGVLIIGRPRRSNQDTFIAAEIVQYKQIQENPLWLVKRKEELLFISNSKEIDDEFSSLDIEESKIVDDVQVVPLIEEEIIKPKDPVELSDDKLIEFIKNNDSTEGCLIEDLINHFGEEIDNMVLMLIAMGEIYEIKPGRIKVLE